MDEAGRGGKQISIQYDAGDNVVTRIATQSLLQFTGQEYLLSFYEVRPPLVVGSPDEMQRQLDKIDSVRGECIARLAFTPVRLRELSEVIAKHIAATDS